MNSHRLTRIIHDTPPLIGVDLWPSMTKVSSIQSHFSVFRLVAGQVYALLNQFQSGLHSPQDVSSQSLPLLRHDSRHPETRVRKRGGVYAL